MYVIETALSSKFKPLAIIFSVAGLVGCLPMFQANQLTQTIREEIFVPMGLFTGSAALGNGVVGVIIACVVAGVIFGGIKRIGLVASRLVPFMVLLYLFAGVLIIMKNITAVPGVFSLILHDAFTGQAVVGGAVGQVIRTGVRRAAFSNEAGLGTEAMAHGAAKTKEPVREGLVAMTGPFIDTIVICSITALVILISGVWETTGLNGVTMTVRAFTHELGNLGKGILMLCILIFSITTMFSQSYYGTKCTSYLFGTRWKQSYKFFYIIAAVFGATVSLGIVINLIDGMYAVMAFPTMISTLILAPRVMAEARRYFSTLK
jgi:AGCS family alanine or glycine:cation symporter